MRLEKRIRALEARLISDPVMLYFADGSTRHICGRGDFLLNLLRGACGARELSPWQLSSWSWRLGESTPKSLQPVCSSQVTFNEGEVLSRFLDSVCAGIETGELEPPDFWIEAMGGAQEMRRSVVRRVQKLVRETGLDDIPGRPEFGMVYLLRDKPPGGRSVFDVYERAGQGFQARERVVEDPLDMGLDCETGGQLPSIAAEMGANSENYEMRFQMVMRIPRDADAAEASRRIPSRYGLYVEKFSVSEAPVGYFPCMLAARERSPSGPGRRRLTYSSC